MGDSCCSDNENLLLYGIEESKRAHSTEASAIAPISEGSETISMRDFDLDISLDAIMNSSDKDEKIWFSSRLPTSSRLG